MQGRSTARAVRVSQTRLQLILFALAAWNFLGLFLELTNTAILDVGDIDGVFGARAVDGTSGVLAIAYVYAARNPVRYRFIVWLAALEQFIALFSYTFHWARGDVGPVEALLPIIAAGLFLVLLLTNLPRQTDTIGA
jgi:hypothetical protein